MEVRSRAETGQLGAEVEIILGTGQQFAGRYLLRIDAPEDRPQMMAEFQKCLTERKPMRADFRIPRIDGSVGWMALTAVPYFDADGRPTHIIGTVRDITEQKLRELWLRAQNEILRTIAVGVPAHGVFTAISSMLRDALNAAMVAVLIPDSGGRLSVVTGVGVPTTTPVSSRPSTSSG